MKENKEQVTAQREFLATLQTREQELRGKRVSLKNVNKSFMENESGNAYGTFACAQLMKTLVEPEIGTWDYRQPAPEVAQVTADTIGTGLWLTSKLQNEQLYVLGIDSPSKTMRSAAGAILQGSPELGINRFNADRALSLAKKGVEIADRAKKEVKEMIANDNNLQEEVMQLTLLRLPTVNGKERENFLEELSQRKIREKKARTLYTKEVDGIVRVYDEYTVDIERIIPQLPNNMRQDVGWETVKKNAKEVLIKEIKDQTTDQELADLLSVKVYGFIAQEAGLLAVRKAIAERSPGFLPWSITEGTSEIDLKDLEERTNAFLAESLEETIKRLPKTQRLLPKKLPNVVVEDEQGNAAKILGMDQLACLTENNVMYLLENMIQSPNLYGLTIGEREGVKIYMVNKTTKEMLLKISGFLSDLSNIPETVLLPETEDEMNCLLTMAARAITTGRPITLSTPFCPDWSRDNEGKYDFKSLGGGESFIAAKFFANAPAILSAFENNGIPFIGRLRFADWGLETEIDAKDTYGQELSQEDIQMCFASTIATTDQTLQVLQNDPRIGKLFSSYQIVSMKEFLATTINEEEVKAKMRNFFTTDERGKNLLEKLAKQSFSINQKRLRLSPEENRDFVLNSLVEYSTEGAAEDESTILIMCESRTTSRCYNLPRDKAKKIPVFYVKGQAGVNEGVNIL